MVTLMTLASKLTLNSLPFRRELAKVGSVTKAQSNTIGKLMMGAGATAAVGVALMTAATAKLAIEGTKLAARNEMLATSLEVVGQNAGWEAAELYKAVDAVKEKGITTSQATTAVTRFIQSQLALGKSSELATEEVSKLARVSQDLAVVAGVNSSEALGTLMQATSSLRPMLVKQFGIVDGLQVIYKTYADSVGKSASALTEAEKRQAFLNRIFLEGEKVAGAYEAAMGTVGKQLTSLPRYVEEGKVAIGEIFLPIMGAAVTMVTNFWKAVIKAAPVLKERFGPAVERFAETMLNLQGVVGSVLDFFRNNWEVVFSAVAAVLVVTVVPSLGLLSTAIGVAVLSLEAFAIAQAAALWPIAAVAAAIYLLIEAFKALKVHNEEANLQAAETSANALASASSYEAYSAAVVAAYKKNDTFLASMSDTDAALVLQQNALLKTEHAWTILNETTGKSYQEITKVHTAIEKFGEAPEILGDVASSAEAVTQELDGMAIAAQGMGDAYVEALGSGKVSKAFENLQTLMTSHASETVRIEESALQARSNSRWKFATDQRIKTVQYQAEMERLRIEYVANLARIEATGNATAAAELTAAYGREVAESQRHFDEAQTLAEWNAKVQAQIDERGLLEQRVVRAREYVEQLKAKHQAIDDELRLAILGKTGMTRIQIETGKALLRVLDISTTERLRAEGQYAIDSVEIAKQWASGQLTSMEAVTKALVALQLARAGETAAAQAELDRLQGLLDAFEVELPPLTLPPDTSFAETAQDYGEKTEQVTQKIAFDMVAGMARAISATKQAIKDLVGLEIPAGFDQGLDIFESASIKLATRFHSIWSKLQDKLEDAAEGAEGLNKIAQSVRSLVGGIVAIEDIDLDVPWLSHLGAFVTRTTQLLDAMIPKLRELNAKWKDDLELLEAWAKATQTLGSIMSVMRGILDIASAKTEAVRMSVGTFFDNVLGIMEAINVWRGRGAEEQALWDYIEGWQAAIGERLTDWAETLKPLATILSIMKGILGTTAVKVADVELVLATFFDNVLALMEAINVWRGRGEQEAALWGYIEGWQEAISGHLKAWADALKPLADILKMARTVLSAAADEAGEVNLDVGVLFDRVIDISRAVHDYIEDTPGFAADVDAFVTDAVPTLERCVLAMKPISDVLSLGQSILGTASTKAADVALQVDTLFDRVWQIAEAVADWVDNKGAMFAAKLTALLDPETGILATIEDLIDVLDPISRLLKTGTGLLAATSEKAETVALDFIALLDEIWAMAQEIGKWVTDQGPEFAADVAELKVQLVGVFTDLVDAIEPVEGLMKTVADAVKAAESVSEGQLDSAFNQRLIPAIKNIRLSLSNLYAELVAMDLEFMPDLNDRMTKLSESLELVLDAIADIGRSDVTESPTALLDEFNESLRDSLTRAESRLDAFIDYLGITFLGLLEAIDYGPATTGVLQTIIDASAAMEGSVYAAGFDVGSSWRDGALDGLGGPIPLPDMGGDYGEGGGGGGRLGAGNTYNLTANYPYQDKTSLKDTVQLLQAGLS